MVKRTTLSAFFFCLLEITDYYYLENTQSGWVIFGFFSFSTILKTTGVVLHLKIVPKAHEGSRRRPATF